MKWDLILMVGLYTIAGMLHFVFPKTYKVIIPPYFPQPALLVYLSGVIEILLGLGVLWEVTRNLALWGLIAMLMAFMPVHIFMLKNKKAGMGLPQWLLWLRIPLQFLLIYWAWIYL